MKYKSTVFSALSFFFLIGLATAGAQTLIPQYSRLSVDNPFSGYRKPIGLAILKFGHDAVLDIRLFNAMKQDTAVLGRFTIFPYSVLQAQMSVLGLSSLDPNNERTLRELKDQLNISLAVTGTPLDNGFELRIFSFQGNVVYSHTFLNSIKSTAVDDAEKLFSSDVQTNYINLGDINWVLLKGGSFEMGSNDGYSDEKPVHSVVVRSFYMSATPVTFAQYDAFCRATGRPMLSDSGWGRGKMPVSDVSWDDATAYCSWISHELGDTITLPTEAQYEYAARGGLENQGYVYSGSNYIDDVAWFVGNSKGRPHEVGGRMANQLGIYDLSGDVWEWCQDWYHSTYDGAPSSDSSWSVQDPNTPYHVVRGGSYRSSSYNCRVSVRNSGTFSGWVNSAGFRLVKQAR